MSSALQKRSRKLKEQLRNIQHIIRERREDLAKPDNKQAHELLQQLQQLQEDNTGKNGSESAPEGVMISQILLDLTKLMNRQALSLDTAYISLDATTYRESLSRIADQNSDDDAEGSAKRPKMDWAVLGQLAQGIAAPLPAFNIMYGPLSMDLSKRVVTKSARSKVDPNAIAVLKPTANKQEIEKDMTAVRIQEVSHYLSKALEAAKRKTPPGGRPAVDFFEFVVNPNDFGQTVENIFHLSFLVKEGDVSIFLNENGLPCIGSGAKSTEMNEANARKQLSEPRIQHVMSISYTEWQAVKEAYNITESFLPHRTNEE
eukprot:m.102902 g.102902  ORF g.102902 m.102902 type:complete len:316 (+) comp15026_c1_seq2:245-1192(+)